MGPIEHNDNYYSRYQATIQFGALFNASPSSSVALLPDLTIVAVTDNYLRDTKSRREDLIGQYLFHAFPDNPDDPHANGVLNLKSSLIKVLKTGKPDRMEVQKYDIRVGGINSKVFEERYWSPLNTPVLHESGEILYLLHTVEDVTESIRVKNSLIESEERFKNLLEKIPHIVWIINPAGDLLFVSDQLGQYVGKSIDHHGRGTNSLEYIHPDDHETTILEFNKAFKEKKGLHFRQRIKNKYGEYRWHLVKGGPIFNPLGELIEWVGTTTDIQDQIESAKALYLAEHSLTFTEEVFDLATSATGIGIWELDILTGKNWRSVTHDLAYGFAEYSDDRQGDFFINMIVPEERQNIKSLLTSAVQTGTPLAVEYRFKRPDGKIHWMAVEGRAIRDDYGKLVRYLGTNQDITERKLAELDLRDSVEALAKERNLREAFVMTLSHDLRTPLTSAKLSSQLLNKRAADPNNVHKLAGKIINSIDRADCMIRDLLDANQIKAGELLHLSKEKVEVVSLVEDTLDELSTVQGDRFVLKANDKIEMNVNVEGLRRIVENLCSNAVKYGDPALPITVSITDVIDSIRITVHNSGNPIPPEDLESLFELFRRSSTAMSGNQKGWGIGLTIVKGLVEAQSGTIKVESSAKYGTTFEISLPKS